MCYHSWFVAVIADLNDIVDEAIDQIEEYHARQPKPTRKGMSGYFSKGGRSRRSSESNHRQHSLMVAHR